MKHPRARQRSRRRDLTSLISLLTISFLLTPTSADDSSSPACHCYLVSGPQPGYFSNHYFIDFRNLTPTLGSDYNASVTPSIVPASATAGAEPPTNSYFTTDKNFTSFWSINNTTGEFNWNDGGSVPQVASAQNVWIAAESSAESNSSSGQRRDEGYAKSTSSDDNSTYLSMRTTRLPTFQSVAEIDSINKDMLYLSLRARLRVVPQNDGAATTSVVDSGGVFGLFTYASDTQESDLEILSRDSAGQVRLTNQPDVDSSGNEIAGATEAIRLPNHKKWTQWLDFRVDWFNGQSRWWVDGLEIGNLTKNVPSVAGGVVLNVWGDGGEWSGNMTEGGEMVVGVQWVEVVFNRSADVGKGGVCGVGCWVDHGDVSSPGTPALAYTSNATSGNAAAEIGVGGGTGWAWIGALLVVLVSGLMGLI